MLNHYFINAFIAMHIILFIDISRLQKNPLSTLNHVISGLLAAAPSLLLAFFFTESTWWLETCLGALLTVLISFPITLYIQKILPLNISA